MPARSQAQREALNAKFGHDWVKAHGFDNTGKLPPHAPPHKGKALSRAQINREQMIAKFQAKHGRKRGRQAAQR